MSGMGPVHLRSFVVRHFLCRKVSRGKDIRTSSGWASLQKEEMAGLLVLLSSDLRKMVDTFALSGFAVILSIKNSSL